MIEDKKSVSVKILIDGRKLKCDPDPVEVIAGGEIEWTFDPEFPFGVFVKPLVSPLEKNFYCAQIGEAIRANVRKDAKEASYKYAVGTTDGDDFLCSDPEIIVRRPR